MKIHKGKVAVGFVTALAAIALMAPLLAAGTSAAATKSARHSSDHQLAPQ